jgi:hypothetical protein
MTLRRAAPAAAAAALLLVAGCGGRGETTTVAVTETVTQTETVTETTPLEEDRAYLLASDFCETAPLGAIALLQGGSAEDLAREFSERIRPELREAPLERGLAGLDERD